jgi:hypothetical protein
MFGKVAASQLPSWDEFGPPLSDLTDSPDEGSPGFGFPLKRSRAPLDWQIVAYTIKSGDTKWSRAYASDD